MRAVCGSWLLCGALALAVSDAAAGQHQPSRAVQSSTVKVTAFLSAPDPRVPWQRKMTQVSGSGAVITGQRILTSAHVVAGHAAIEVQGADLGARYTAELEQICHDCDLALLRVSDPEFFEGVPALAIGDLPRQQDPVDLYGFPEGGEGLSITTGIVSRVEVSDFAHSWRRLLIAQVDSAINAGNSGGPAVSGGRLVGIAMQSLEEAENVGYLVPTPVIRHFLDDVRDGRYDGFPELGVFVQTLENAALREHLGLGDMKGGVLVTEVSRRGCASGRLRPGDVLLALDGVPVRADNKVDLEGFRLESTVLEHRAQVGQEITVTVFRDGATRDERVSMTAPDPLVELGEGPGHAYRIFAGLVFQPLTLRYLQAFDEKEAPAHLWRHYEHPGDYMAAQGDGQGPDPREEIVVLTNVLASDLTRGYEGYESAVVEAVDGVRLRSLAHLSELLDKSSGEFVSLRLERGAMLTVRRETAQARSAQILERYGVSADRSPGAAPVPASAF